ncbi:MAG: hypothetical protein QM758_22795 [Armatimonas sp.]
MNYPLELKFKILALASEATVTDATGQVVMYVKQKAFKLKQDIQIFSDATQTRQIYTIKADKVLAVNANYHFTDEEGMPLGRIQREGMKSLWKATYHIFDADRHEFTISEANPWIKVADAALREIPGVGMLTGYLFNPSYNVARTDGTIVLQLKKAPSFLGRFFHIEKLGDIAGDDEERALLGLFMLDVLERGRG